MNEKKFRIKVYDVPTPYSEGFDVEVIINRVLGGALEKRFPGIIEGTPYFMKRSEYEIDLREWVLEVQQRKAEAEKTIAANENVEKVLRALMEQCFLLKSGSVTECVLEFEQDPHAALFGFMVEDRRQKKLQDVLIEKWSVIKTEEEGSNVFWIFDAASEDDVHEHVPILVGRLEEGASKEGKRLVIEYITLGCGNAIGQKFLRSGEAKFSLSSEELKEREVGSNNIYESEEHFRQNALSWIVQYCNGSLGFKPRFYLTEEQYASVKKVDTAKTPRV